MTKNYIKTLLVSLFAMFCVNTYGQMILDGVWTYPKIAVKQIKLGTNDPITSWSEIIVFPSSITNISNLGLSNGFALASYGPFTTNTARLAIQGMGGVLLVDIPSGNWTNSDYMGNGITGEGFGGPVVTSATDIVNGGFIGSSGYIKWQNLHTGYTNGYAKAPSPFYYQHTVGDNGVAYAVGQNGVLYGLKQDGTTNNYWDLIQPPNTYFSRVIYTNDTVFAYDKFYVYSLNPVSGVTNWVAQTAFGGTTNGGPQINSQIAVDGGIIYVNHQNDDIVMTLDTTTGATNLYSYSALAGTTGQTFWGTVVAPVFTPTRVMYMSQGGALHVLNKADLSVVRMFEFWNKNKDLWHQ